MSRLSPLLAELHRLRRHLRELQTEIDRGPRVIKAHQAKLAKHEEAFKAAQDGLKKLKLTISEKEGSLKATFQQIKRAEKQLEETSSQKEYAAKQHELENCRALCAKLEEEILLGMTEVEEQTARLPELEKELQAARQEYAKFEQEAQERMGRLTRERDDAQKLLAETEKQLPVPVVAQYQRLVKAHGADALAAVRNQCCTHCNSTLTVDKQLGIERSEFVCCPSCGRALYRGD